MAIFRRSIIILVLCVLFINLIAQENKTEKLTKRPKVGLVFSGGGAKGFAYIGLLKVLQEINMPIDYVGGSSIGAIVGGMYAVGYHPDTIEAIVRSKDWNSIINNMLERKYTSFEEKQFTEKAILSIPIDNNKVSIGSSFTESLNVDLLLNRIFSPVFHINDFNDLEVPFLCIGTDLLTGEAVVLDSGSLPQAIRGSMSIPGFFPPFYYQGRYLIDGGVVNNYPAEQVKQMGADIIIGADVQAKAIESVDELGSIPKIIDHIIGYKRVDAYTKGMALTDYYVRFDMGYSMMDFTEYDSIIALGYNVAMQHYDGLKRLADSLNSIEECVPRKLEATCSENIFIDNVSVEGDEKLKLKVVKNYFPERNSEDLTITEIEESIKHLSGTKSFKSLNYKLYEEDKKNMLKLSFEKAGQGVLSAGMNYNNDYEGNISLNFAFRNIWNTRAKIFADVIIGQSPRFYGLFLINNGKVPGFGFDVDLYHFKFSSHADQAKKNNFDYRNLSTSVFVPVTFNNSMIVKAGFRYDFFRYDQEFPDPSDSLRNGEYDHFTQLFASVDVDNRDRPFFSTKGGVMQIKMKYALSAGNVFTDNSSNNIYLYARYKQNLRVFKSLVFKPSVFAGYAKQSNTTIHSHLFALGGQSSFNYIDGIVPFTGLRFVEHVGLYAAVGRTHFQYNLYKKFYLNLMADFGFVEKELDDIDMDAVAVGYGVKLSYDSFIGPIGLSIMGSNELPGVSYFVNIGYPLK